MGLISIPGMMTGQILGGAPAMQAAMYQQIMMFLIAASSTLGTVSSVIVTLTANSRPVYGFALTATIDCRRTNSRCLTQHQYLLLIEKNVLYY